nr:CHAT domain-containing protein [Nonomuraea jiangxiensis]
MPGAASPGRRQLVVSSGSASVLAQPWELLTAQGDDQAPFGAGVVRTLRTFSAGRPITAAALRVLVMIARPEGLEAVPSTAILRPLFKIFDAEAGRVRVHVADPPTLESFAALLETAVTRRVPYHLVYLDVHGGHHVRENGVAGGYVVLEDDDWRRTHVSAEVLAAMIARSGVRAVVLNACQSALVAPPWPTDAAVATALMNAGVPAVVGMTARAQPKAASTFLQAMTTAFLEGIPLSEAVEAGRAALRADPVRVGKLGPQELADWLVPVMYASGDVTFRPSRRIRSAAREPARPSLDMLPSIAIGRDEEITAIGHAFRKRRCVVLQGVRGSGRSCLAFLYAAWFRRTRTPNSTATVSTQVGAIEGEGVDDLVAWVVDHLTTHDSLLVWDDADAAIRAGQGPLLADMAERLESAGRGRLLIVANALTLPEHHATVLQVAGLDAVAADQYVSEFAAARADASPDQTNRLLNVLQRLPGPMEAVLPWLGRLPEHPLRYLDGVGDISLLRLPGHPLHRAFTVDVLGVLGGYGHDERLMLRLITVANGMADANTLAHLSALPDCGQPWAGTTIEGWQAILTRLCRDGLAAPTGIPEVVSVHPALRFTLLADWASETPDAFAREYAALRLRRIRVLSGIAAQLLARFDHADIAAVTATALLSHTVDECLEDALKLRHLAEAHILLTLLDRLYDRIASPAAREKIRGLARRVLGHTGHLPGSPERDALARRTITMAARDRLLDQDWDEATLLLDTCDDVGVPTADDPGMAFLRGRIAEERGRLTEARDRYEQVLRLHKDSAEARFHLANVDYALHLASGDQALLTMAERLYRELLAEYEPRRDNHGQATCWYQLSRVAELRGDHRQALRFAERARSFYLRAGDSIGMTLCSLQVGHALRLAGRYTSAAMHYRTALERSQQEQDRATMCRALGALAGVLYQDDPAAALDCLVRAAGMYHTFPDEALPELQRDLAWFAGAAGWDAVDEAWRRANGRGVPEHVREALNVAAAEQ